MLQHMSGPNDYDPKFQTSQTEAVILNVIDQTFLRFVKWKTICKTIDREYRFSDDTRNRFRLLLSFIPYKLN